MNAVAQLNAALAGRYAVEREIGAGGMATVYLARDIKHDRNVALKVLLPELGAVLGVERFQSEIKVTANLQHPNLLPLFDSGEANGLLFYVMPYVEGESLRARLDREKQLPIDESLRIAGAVASALDYAHRHEVIHRDLKPENILLHDGQPLVADFGIALAVSKAGGQRVTQTGLSLGTPQYMSPEQATGDRVIDGRTDIYSLGALTYEMLAGEPPHLGTTAQAIIAKVLTEKPRSVRLARPSVPEHVEFAVEKALEKLAADRWATAKEFGEALTDARRPQTAATSQTGRGDGKGTKQSMSNRATILLTVGASLAGVIATKVADRWRSEKPVLRDSRFVIAVPDSMQIGAVRAGGHRVAISRDGAQIAYVTDRGGTLRIVVRSLSDPSLRVVQGTEGGMSPVFSPDGRWLAFIGAADRRLRKVPVAGGSPVVLADSAATSSWGSDGSLVYTRLGTVCRVSQDGGTPRCVIAADTSREPLAVGSAHALPGGKYAVVSVVRGTDSDLSVIDLDDGHLATLGIAGFTPRYDGNGHLFFGRSDGTLFVAPFSLRKLAITGPPVPLVRGLQQPYRGFRVDYDVADDGTLAFLGGPTSQRQLMRVDRQGTARLLSTEDRIFGWPKISPDGRRVALEIGEPGTPRFDIWVYDVPSRTLSRLTSNNSGFRTAGWTRDGRRVVFVAADSAGPGGGTRLTMVQSVPWDNSGPIDTLTRVTGRRLWEATLGPPRSWLVARTVDRTAGGLASGGELVVAPLDTPTALRPFLTTPANELTPRLSPDGRYLAYASDETGSPEVYVRPVPGPGGRLKVSNGGGTVPIWAPSGRELFYRAGTHLVAASLSLSGEMSVLSRANLFEDVYYRDGAPQYDVFPGGNEFLMIREAPGTGVQLDVILNWQALLKKQ